MNGPFVNTLILGAGYLLLFGSGEMALRLFKPRPEVTRKYIHFCSGLIALMFPLLIKDHWYVLLLCSSFAAILLLSQKFGMLNSINGIDRRSFGSISYPAAVYGTYLFYDQYDNLLYFYLPLLIMATADPAAGLVGKRWPVGIYKVGSDHKSLTGSATFFIVAMIVSLVLFHQFALLGFMDNIMLSSFCACVSTITEAMTRKGFDNITIPASVIAVLFLYTYSGFL